MIKRIFSFILVLFVIPFVQAQVITKDTTEVEKPLIRQDTIVKLPIELQEVYVSNKYRIHSDEERKRYLILQRRVLKVYPYAKIAADRLSALNKEMDGLTNERDKKKYFKLVENYLTNEFEAQLKKLSRKDGQILVKLIHRQTGTTTFDLIKSLKSGWKAFWSNNTARLFDINLKTQYDPYIVSEDFLIEGILYRAFYEGRLVKQASKVPMNYSELAKLWREKLNIVRSDTK